MKNTGAPVRSAVVSPTFAFIFVGSCGGLQATTLAAGDKSS